MLAFAKAGEFFGDAGFGAGGFGGVGGGAEDAIIQLVRFLFLDGMRYNPRGWTLHGSTIMGVAS